MFGASRMWRHQLSSVCARRLKNTNKMPLKSKISKNLAEIYRKIHATGRDAGEIRLVAVTKYAEDDAVAALVELGLRDFGESRQQSLTRRAEMWTENGVTDIRWHFIGPLQKNKMRRVVQTAELIHSGESLEMLTAMDRVAGEENRRVKVLLEVNLSGESAKHGFTPAEISSQIAQILALPHLEIHGLMGMTALDADENQARAQFASLRLLRDTLRTEIGQISPQKAEIFNELSMGMSDDYEIAVREGATIIRIGSAVFAE